MNPKSFPVASPGNASASLQKICNPVVKVKEYLKSYCNLASAPKANLYGS
jgi:hypothetical protein